MGCAMMRRRGVEIDLEKNYTFTFKDLANAIARQVALVAKGDDMGQWSMEGWANELLLAPGVDSVRMEQRSLDMRAKDGEWRYGATEYMIHVFGHEAIRALSIVGLEGIVISGWYGKPEQRDARATITIGDCAVTMIAYEMKDGGP